MIPHDFVVSPYISSVFTQVTILNLGIFVLCITIPVQPRLSSAFMQNWILALGSEVKTKASRWRTGSRSCSRERGVGRGGEVWVTYSNYRRSSPSYPLTSNSHPNGTCPQDPEGRGRGQTVESSGRQGPLEPERCANPGELRATSSTPYFGRSSPLSDCHDHSLTVPVHTNQDLWVLLWSPLPPFGVLFSTSSPLPAATGIPKKSFSRQNLLASSCRKRAHLCRKAGRRALSYPGLCRTTSVYRPGSTSSSTDPAQSNTPADEFGIDERLDENWWVPEWNGIGHVLRWRPYVAPERRRIFHPDRVSFSWAQAKDWVPCSSEPARVAPLTT